MPVLLARIDDRLIHGQVVVGWATDLKADHIAVISDEVAANDMQKFLFRMATPTEIELSILGIQEGAGRISKREFDDSRVIVLFRTPEDALRTAEQGGRLGEINIGGMHFSKSKTGLFDAVFADVNDVEMLLKLYEMGTDLEVRMVPTDQKKNPLKAIEEKFGMKPGPRKDRGK